jgi:hypothetical protein
MSPGRLTCCSGHLVATEPDALGGDSALMALARIGALAIVTRAELGADRGAGCNGTLVP